MLAESLWAFLDKKSRKRRATSIANHSSGRILLTGSRRRFFFRAKAEISRTHTRLLFPSRVPSRAPQKLLTKKTTEAEGNRIRKYPSERKLARGWGFMLALYRQETIILHSIGFEIMGFMAFTCSKPRKPDTFFLDRTLPGCEEASCKYKLPSGSRQTRPPPPPPQPPADSCRRCIGKQEEPGLQKESKSRQ